ncbi:hypothetical protein DVH24_004369 [Malus domestica]|uniref:Uncharacterized protein n=1 Tax=Malus domestica TaxID=3750 RepID=A0A498IEA8_MALDO|nr:hypothetical protein DVH24_004369 [Malus domestica]
MKAFLQQLLNKIFTSVLDNDLDPSNLDWATIILAYCLSTTIGMALVPIQLHSKQLPISFCFLGLIIRLSFSSIFVSKFIQYFKCSRIIVHLVHYFDVFFGVIAFFISITIPFPLWFKFTASIIYAALGLVILFCHHYYN